MEATLVRSLCFEKAQRENIDTPYFELATTDKNSLVVLDSKLPTIIRGIRPPGVEFISLVVLFNVGRHKITIEANSHMTSSKYRIMMHKALILKPHQRAMFFYFPEDGVWR